MGTLLSRGQRHCVSLNLASHNWERFLNDPTKQFEIVNLTDRLDRYIVDAADKAALPIATEELHDLLSKPSLDGIPLLVLGNKSDLPEKLSVDDLIEVMDLKSITRREVSCYGISAKEETNLDAVLHWLIGRASR